MLQDELLTAMVEVLQKKLLAVSAEDHKQSAVLQQAYWLLHNSSFPADEVHALSAIQQLEHGLEESCDARLDQLTATSHAGP